MCVIKEIDFFSDEVLRCRLMWMSIIILAPAVALCVYCGYKSALGMTEPVLLLPSFFSEVPELSWLFWLALITIVILPIHELIHALFFKIFGGTRAKIIFGYKNGMLYAGCPGTVLSKASFIVVLLAPATILSLICLGAAVHSGCPLLWISILLIHLSGCTGDLLGVVELVHNKACTHCEDTEQGFKLLGA